MKQIITPLLLIAFTFNAHAADSIIGNITKAEAIKHILGGDTILKIDEELDITEQLLESQKAKDVIASKIYDSVEIVRAPIFFSTDPSSEPAEIYVTQTRPTTISFFRQGGETLPIIHHQNASKNDNKITERFGVKEIESLPHAFAFTTSVTSGSTTVDFFFKDLNYSIPMKLVAGKKYHSSAQAILIDSAPIFKKQQNSSVSGTDNDIQLNIDDGVSTKNTLRQKMFLYANYSKKPPTNEFNPVSVEFFNSTSYTQPIVDAILIVENGQKMFLIYTNGQLRSPDFKVSEPSNKPTETIWVYAILESDVPNLISIVYGGGTHLVSLEVQNSLGLDRSVTSASTPRR